MTQYTQKAFKLDKEFPMTCAMFGGYFLLRKSYPTVDALARKAIEHTDVMPIASDGWYLLARMAHYEGETDRAAEYYNRSDQARGGGDKGYLPAKFGAVQTQVMNKDYGGAKLRLEKMIQQTKNAESMVLLGALHAEEIFELQKSGDKEDKSNEIKRAISLLESVRLLWRDESKVIAPDESVLIYLSRLYEQTAPEKSMQCLVQLEQMQLADVPEAERPVDAENEEQMKVALRQHLPPQLLNNMGCFLYQDDKVEAARSMFHSALNACDKWKEKEGRDTDALVTTISYNLGRAYEAVSLPDEAKKIYEGVVERHSDYTDVNARLTYISLRQSPTDEGPKKMAKLYESESGNLEVRALFGWYLSKSKKRVANLAEDHEQRHYKHTLQYFDKHDRYSLTGMGNVHMHTARDMRRDSEQDKEKRRRMYERAVEFFDKALQLDPRNAYAAQGIAIALVDDKKDHATAVHIFSKVRDTLRDSSVYVNLGHVYAELRQYSRSIEHYETALAKDRPRDAQILACLGRVWLLKGKQEMNLGAMRTGLDYAQRARGVASGQIHMEFNVAFVQYQIASLTYSLPETQKAVQDIEAALEGLKEAVETFDRISKAKNPPYPAGSLEQRASMGRNTIVRQLERALQNQREYEERNATKLKQAREARDAEIRRREEEVQKAQEVEQERKKKVMEERQLMIEEAQKLAEQRAEEERAREEAEFTTEEETGNKVKRKKKASKRKKKTDDFVEDDDEAPKKAKSTEPEESEGDAAPKKRRRLERRSGAKTQNKFKSKEMVVDSDDEEGGGGAQAEASGGAESDNDEAMRDVNADEEGEEVVQRRRAKPSRRVADDEEEEEEEEEATAAAGPDEGDEGDGEDDLFNEAGEGGEDA
jgi:RNA polymerase-associated protein CTR9